MACQELCCQCPRTWQRLQSSALTPRAAALTHWRIPSQHCLSKGSFLTAPLCCRHSLNTPVQSRAWLGTDMHKDRSFTLGSDIAQLSLITAVKSICEDRGPCGGGINATQMLLCALSILSLIYNVPLFLHMLHKRNEQLVIVSKFTSSIYLKTSQPLQPSQQTGAQRSLIYKMHSSCASLQGILSPGCSDSLQIYSPVSLFSCRMCLESIQLDHKQMACSDFRHL